MQTAHPDIPLDDEIESHIDHGRVQVEPGDPANEERELLCGYDDELSRMTDVGL